MKHIHRDNFRHLTGHGRDIATYTDFVISQWVSEKQVEFPIGNLMIQYAVDRKEYSGYFVPNEHPEVDQYEDVGGGLQGRRHLMLSLFIVHNQQIEITALPLVMVLQGAPNYSGLHQMYRHDFLRDKNGDDIEGACYYGVTKRGWRTRWAEHVRSAERGSHYLFHKAMRRWSKARLVHHTIVAAGLSQGDAMAVEEHAVANETLHPLGLNMVPGGSAGLAYLRKIGAIGASERVSLDDRQTAINRFFERASRKGLSNPLAAANWMNPEYAEKVICAGPDRLKPQQIRDARYMASLGQDAQTIATRIDARNIAQVERLLSGSTYSRVA